MLTIAVKAENQDRLVNRLWKLKPPPESVWKMPTLGLVAATLSTEHLQAITGFRGVLFVGVSD